MLKVKPLKKYDAPDYPTKESASGEMLAGLPLCWKKNKRELVCMGMIGAIALTGFVGCRGLLDNGGEPRMTDYVHNYTEQEALDAFIRQSELFVGSHLGPVDHGGAPRMVDYILAFTEQEALDIIKSEAATFGINLTETENIRSFEISSRLGTKDVTILLSDEELGVEIAHLHYWLWLVSEPFGRDLPLSAVSDMIQDAPIPRNGDAVLGVFLNPAGGGSVCGDGNMERAERRLEEIKDNLVMQVHDFIEWLKQEGILQP